MHAPAVRQPDSDYTIIGAGPVGTLLAILLARRGWRVRVLERRSDPGTTAAERGRSINLALASRGMQALARAGVLERITPAMVMMPGRQVHEAGLPPRFLRYGQRPEEVIWAISRALLSEQLILAARTLPGITLQFDARLVDLDPQRGELCLEDTRHGTRWRELATRVLCADGALSAARGALVARGEVSERLDWLAHDYQELQIAPQGGAEALALHALHIWPRGGFMLIALPNADDSFTATLFLARQGNPSFAQLQQAGAFRRFFEQEFPDVSARIPDLEAQFAAHPQSRLATVHAQPWHAAGRVLLIGDAAHGIVPFHGQGLNCGFEDCLVLDALLGREGRFADVCTQFQASRQPDTEAIGAMALENYAEMRAQVLDPQFVRRRELAAALEVRFPGRFIPRYSMVMFHPEIPYAEAQRRGALQEQLLSQLLVQHAGSTEGAAALLDAAGL